MTSVDEIIEQIGVLQRADLEAWISQELVEPHAEAGTLLFSEFQSARIRLICALHYDMEIETETLPVVLSLVDQLYETRERLMSLTAAIAAQDKDIQTAILAAIGRRSDVDEKIE